MLKIKLSKTLIIYLLASFLVNCNLFKPEDILPGENKCEHCQMNIMNPKFQAQIISSKGKKYHFDSIECMTSWWINHPEITKSLFVKNYLDSKEWIDLDKSFILQSAKISSPMKANLSAYSNIKSIKEQIEENGGRLISIEELKDFISNEWEKEIQKNQDKKNP